MQLVATTFHGLEEILADEIRTLGAEEVTPLRRAVKFQGDKAMLYRCNYELRTAIRILKPFYHFTARSERQLYHKIYTYNWAMHLDSSLTFAITANVHSHYFRHSQYVALKMKDAIVDQFRKKIGKRPSVDSKNPQIRFNIHVNDDEFSISLDSTGQSLHRRGYRDLGHQAPLNEVLSAGMLKLAGYDGSQTLLDPMCGTGTNLFEALMIAKKIPTGFYRKDTYCFQSWKDYDETLFSEIKENADGNMTTTSAKIIGGDNNPSAYRITLETIDELVLGNDIEVNRKPYQRNKPEVEPGLLMMNPPYGERLKINDITSFYKMIGDTMKQNFPGWQAWIISSNLEALKHIGLKPSKKHILFNGPLECRYLKFDLYTGRKEKYKG